MGPSKQTDPIQTLTMNDNNDRQTAKAQINHKLVYYIICFNIFMVNLYWIVVLVDFTRKYFPSHQILIAY